MPSRFNFFKIARLGGERRRKACISGLMVAATLGGASLLSPALAAKPPAGSSITNVAWVEFTSNGQKITVPSNEVSVTINKVAGISIQSDQTKQAIPGGLTSFFHIITNSGNAADQFALATRNVGAGLTINGIYPANCADGTQIGTTAINQTPPLNPGEDPFCVIVEVSVDSGVTVPGEATFEITATSTNDASNNTPNAQLASNTDTVEFTRSAVFSFKKSFTMVDDRDGSGSFTPGDRVAVRLYYDNIGLDAATNVEIVDNLPNDLNYVAGSGRWSDTSNALSDSATPVTNPQGQTLTYSYEAATTTVRAVLSEVPRRSGYVEFDADIASSASGTLTNIGQIESDQTPSQDAPATIPIDDRSAVSVVLADSRPDTATAHTEDLPDNNLQPAGLAPVSPTDKGTNKGDDIVLETDVVGEGASVPMGIVLTNTSSTSQKFNLSYQLSAGSDRTGTTPLPSGTVITFFTDSGIGLTDTDGDGNPDIVVAAMTSRVLMANVALPLGFTRQASDPITSGLIRATSAINPSKFNETWIDLQNDVLGGGVDLVNVNSDGDELGGGDNPDNGGNPWTTISAERGSTVSFQLRVKNTGLRPDSFALSFTSNPAQLPIGWRVVFKDATNGSIVVNTGIMPGQTSKDIIAEVTVPSDALPQNLDLTFRAASATNANVSDTKLDRVSVNSLVDLGITPNVSRQIEVNGVKDFGHRLENHGNVAITDGAIGYRRPFTQFVARDIYIDLNGNGELDADDQALGPVSSIAQILQKVPSLGAAFDPGETVHLVARVSAPGGMALAYTEVAEFEVATSLTASTGQVTDDNPANNVVTQTAVVSSGIIRVEKLQALDANCDGAPDGAAFAKDPLNADPGSCILYEVKAENISSATAEDVSIMDQTPEYTTIKSTPGALAPVATTNGQAASVTAPADGTAGDVKSTHGTLLPGGRATLKFTVQIDN